MKAKLNKFLALLLSMSLALPMTSAAGAENKKKGTVKTEPFICEEVSRKLDNKGEFIDILVKMKEEASISDAETDADKMKGPDSQELKEKKAYVGLLEEVAERTQKPVKEFLEKEKLKGNVKEYESFYIVNSLHIIAKPEVIKKLKNFDSIEKIDSNEYVENEKPIKVKRRAKRSLEKEINWNLKMINADMVWDKLNIDGSGVTVGIMDSAVNPEHPALKKKFRGYNEDGSMTFEGNYYDAVDKMKEPQEYQYMDHGSHCAGIVTGEDENERFGVAPGAKWINARIFSNNGAAESEIIAAAQWFLKPGNDVSKAPEIINNSWGGSNGSSPWFKASLEAWRNAGILPVFAAGNQEPGEPLPGPGSISNPANFGEAFAVGAVDKNSKLGYFSKKGPSGVPGVTGIKPEISAPGVAVRSSVKHGYEYMSGTSMAAPHVAGVAALVKSAKPDITIDEIESILIETSTPATDDMERTSPNYSYGNGIVNAYAAVKKALGKGEMGTVTGSLETDNKDNGLSGEVYIKETGIRYPVSNSNFTVRHTSGDYTLVVNVYGYEKEEISVSIKDNENENHNIKLKKKSRHSITGRILNEKGEALSNAVIRLLEDTSIEPVTTDDEGRFEIKNIPDGNYTLRITYPECETADKSIALKGKDVTIEAKLKSSAGLMKIELGEETANPGKTDLENIGIGDGGYRGAAVKFLPLKKGGTLESVKIYFTGSYISSGTMVEISVKSMDDLGRTVDETPVKKVMVTGGSWNDIDLSEFNFKSDAPFFIVVYVPRNERSVTLGYDAAFPSDNSYYYHDGNFIPVEEKKPQGAIMMKAVMLVEPGAGENISYVEKPQLDNIVPSDRSVTGRAVAGHKVRVILPYGKRISVIADSEGFFTAKTERMRPGDRVYALAIDKKGYSSDKAETVVRADAYQLQRVMKNSESLLGEIEGSKKEKLEKLMKEGEALIVKAEENQKAEAVNADDTRKLQKDIEEARDEIVKFINESSQLKVKLNKLIEEASEYLEETEKRANGRNVSVDKYWIKPKSWSNFNTLVVNAKLIYSNPTSTEEELNMILIRLEDETNNFLGERKRGLKGEGGDTPKKEKDSKESLKLKKDLSKLIFSIKEKLYLNRKTLNSDEKQEYIRTVKKAEKLVKKQGVSAEELKNTRLELLNVDYKLSKIEK